jgi:hypothetical protein
MCSNEILFSCVLLKKNTAETGNYVACLPPGKFCNLKQSKVKKAEN